MNKKLLDTLNEYAPYFSQLGMSSEEFTSTLIQGSKDGARNLDLVADAVKEFNIRAKDGSDSTSEAFMAIGLSASEMRNAIAKGGEEGKNAFNKTIEALEKMEDPAQRNINAVALFGRDAA